MDEQQVIINLKQLFSEHELDLPRTDSLETLNLAISALEKQIPTNLIKTLDGNLACGCGMIICNKNRLSGLYYCHRCGQRFEIGE